MEMLEAERRMGKNNLIWKCGAALATLILGGCGQNNITTPPVSSAHRVIVVNNNSERIKTITDAATVKKLAAFVNRRLTEWEIPWYGIPVGHTRVEFYSADDTQIGSCSIGENFFERMFMNGNDPVWCVRKAAASELDEFRKLIDTDGQLFDKRPPHPNSTPY